MTDNVTRLCVRAGFLLQTQIRSTHFKVRKNFHTKNVTPPDAKPMLWAGFLSLREAKRFSKMYAYLMIIHTQLDSPEKSAEIVSHLQVEWAYKELEKMNLPDGYKQLLIFDDLLQWFFKTCH